MKKVKAAKLDRAEKALLKSVEAGEWRSVPDFELEKERYRRYAIAALRKDKRINIRISERDLILIQERALDEGLPYQTLISSILHKYVAGRLRESISREKKIEESLDDIKDGEIALGRSNQKDARYLTTEKVEKELS